MAVSGPKERKEPMRDVTTRRPLPNDDEGTWPCFLDRDEETVYGWSLVGGLLLMLAGIGLSWLAIEAGVRIGLRLAGRV